MLTTNKYINTLADPRGRERITVHHLDGSWRDEDKFPSLDYSRFKYGCGIVAKQFGSELAQNFIASNFFDYFSGDGNDIVITASPYKYVAPAASAIMQHFTNYLNIHLASLAMCSANMIKISRSTLFEGDYGKLDQDSRSALLKRDKISIDRDFVQGKTILVIDDIKITGTHEEKIVQLFTEQNIEAKRVIFLYYAEMNNADKVGADYENYLNHFFVKSIDNLASIIADPNFILNARVCKYLLSYPNIIELQKFLLNVSPKFIYDLVAAIIGDGYQRMPSYTENFRLIKFFWMRTNNN